MDVVCDCEYNIMSPLQFFTSHFPPIYIHNYIYNYHHQYNRFYCISLLLRMLSPSLCLSILQSLCGFDEIPIFHSSVAAISSLLFCAYVSILCVLNLREIVSGDE